MARAEQARAALDQFIGPALEVIRGDYMEKLADIAAKPLNADMRAGMEKLALAVKVVDQVRIQIETLVRDGAVARQDKQRADKIAALPAEKRRWL
jgi:hypothetical protein